MLSNKAQLVLAKLEVTEGTDPTPTKAANAILCDNVDPGYAPEQIARRIVNADISDPKILFGTEFISFSILAELKGSGTAGTAPEIGPLLQACGLTETVDAGVSVAYAPTASSGTFKSVTIYLYKGGILWKAVGCRGNFSIVYPAGQYPQITFNVQGKVTGILDTACPTDATYNATLPVQVESAAFSFGSFNDAVIRQFSIESGNPLTPRKDINSAQGVKGYAVMKRNPRYAITAEAELEATHTFWGDLQARTEEAFDLVVGTTAGNIVTLAVPKACPDQIRVSDEEGMMMYEISGQALKNSGNDNFTLTFT